MAQRIFYTNQHRPKVEYAPSGTGIAIEFKELPDKNGSLKPIVTGKTNIYEKIQEAKAGCEIEAILQMCDPNKLKQENLPDEVFKDLTGLPTNMNDMYQAIHKVKATFEDLPLEERNKFGNSFEKFMAMTKQPEELKKILNPKVEEPGEVKNTKKEEVKDESTT